MIIQLCRIGRTNKATHIKGKNQESSGKVWRAITLENLISLYKSMPRRMAAVIGEGKSHTKYWCTIIVDIFINISKEIHLLIGCRVFLGLDSRSCFRSWHLQICKHIYWFFFNHRFRIMIFYDSNNRKENDIERWELMKNE